MILYFHQHCCYQSFSNHTGHPWMLEDSSDSLISTFVIGWFEQSHLASASSCVEKQHKDFLFLFLQLTAVFYCRNFLLLSILSVFVFETHRGGQTVPYIYLSSHYHPKVSRDMHCHKQIILTLRCLKVHRST